MILKIPFGDERFYDNKRLLREIQETNNLVLNHFIHNCGFVGIAASIRRTM